MSHKPITVVHLITELNTGGAEQMLRKLVTRMDAERFRCIVVPMTDHGPIGRAIAASGIPVFPLGMGRGRPTIGGLAKLYHLLRQECVDIVQTWLYHADLLGLVVGRIAEVGKVIWGIRCSDMHLRKYRPLTALTVRLCGALSPLVNAIVVNSHEGKRIHRKRGYHTERMFIIPNGFDTERYRPDPSLKDRLRNELGLSKDAVLIGLVARFDPMKDHATFFKAAANLCQRNEHVHFVLAGRGMEPGNGESASLIDPLLQSRVHLLGLREDIPELMAGLDIASSSSAFGEGFSNTIGEAMSCGVPCVVTDVGDSARIIGDTGLVVPPGDPAALADAWLDMINAGKEERKARGEKARSRIVENFELGKIVKRFEKFYQMVTEKND
jgi:glycosyltransferase involved in cell wall biosynthesis